MPIKSVKSILALFIISIYGVILMAGTAYSKTYTASEMSANPEQLTGMTVSGKRLEGVTFKNVALRNVTFKNLSLSNFTFENVVFDNCKFIDIVFYDGILQDVHFKGGLFLKNSYEIASDEMIETSKFLNVIFDATAFENASFDGISGGPIYFMNIKSVKNYEPDGAILYGNDIFVIVNNCAIKYIDFAIVRGASKIYALNSTFDSSGFVGETKATYIDNCSLLNGSSSGSSELLVIKNSVLLAQVGVHGDAYFYNNTFLHKDGPPREQTGVQGTQKNSKIYVFSDQRVEAPINFMGGTIYLRNANWVQGIMGPLRYVKHINRIDLQNVNIVGGGWWEDLHLLGGRWENVKIYPSIDITNAKLENVEGYNVTYPNGTPWTGKPAADTSIRIRNKPFDWPEIKVPTPKDLGLEWKLPVITGKP